MLFFQKKKQGESFQIETSLSDKNEIVSYQKASKIPDQINNPPVPRDDQLSYPPSKNGKTLQKYVGKRKKIVAVFVVRNQLTDWKSCKFLFGRPLPHQGKQNTRVDALALLLCS